MDQMWVGKTRVNLKAWKSWFVRPVSMLYNFMRLQRALTWNAFLNLVDFTISTASQRTASSQFNSFHMKLKKTGYNKGYETIHDQKLNHTVDREWLRSRNHGKRNKILKWAGAHSTCRFSAVVAAFKQFIIIQAKAVHGVYYLINLNLHPHHQ